MKILWRYSVYVVILAALSPGCRQSWKEYVSRDFGFSVAMPGRVAHEQEIVEMGGKDVEVHSFSAQGSPAASHAVFVNGISDPRTDSNTVFDGGRDAGLEAVGGHLSLDNPKTLDGVRGREIKVRGMDGVFYLSRLYVASGRLCQVPVTVFKLNDASQDIETYFDSFRLTG